ncbi:hypothetical protein SUGI_0804100 [Cryptomeria japonica]|uniref:aspartyl protease AED3-like n=1 Tax=Cryptomeria japonica TaxID=3369 RepID=UPI002414825A|nr:aspartyl protease AED3-like [Cryptomeria japonica]GLJ39377.1 hypothetical protein SUGI_0804100 [Cryptomeria japonica]
MALLVLQSLALLALCCWSSSSAKLLQSSKEEMGSIISRTNNGTISFPLINIHGDASPFRSLNSTRSSRISEWLKSDVHRQQLFQRKENPSQTEAEGEVPLASGAAIDNGNYIIKLGFGTPAQMIHTMVDTGSDVAWIPCNSCPNCKTHQIFEAQKSSTYKLMSCSSAQCGQVKGMCMKGNKCAFGGGYADGSWVTALLSSDELTTGENGKVHISRFIFGCSNGRRGNLEKAPGLVGLGRGTLSFLSQTEPMYGKVFSYCLPSIDSMSFSGTLSLGKGSLSSTQGLRFTPLLPNPAGFPSYYYVGLVGISVGNERFFMPKESSQPSSNGGGTVIDSGTVITRLVDPLYGQVRDSFRRQVKSTMIDPVMFLDTCYRIPSGGNFMVPGITLYLQGGLDLALPQESVLITLDDTGSICLAFASAGPVPEAISVIGNYQQQKLRIVYDVSGSRLGIVPENCDR